MKFESIALVVKISVSDVLKSMQFYTQLLGFQLDDIYTINIGNDYKTNSYMQLNYLLQDKTMYALGLFKDMDKPYSQPPETGTVPSFIVSDIIATLAYFEAQKIVIDKIGKDIIVSNISDDGYVDHFFFFRDPDNNSLVIRQNLGKEKIDV